MRALLLSALFCLVGACSSASHEHEAASGAEGPPMRVISLDYCSDQYVLALIDKDQILALSPDADNKFSYLHEQADGIRQVRPVAESILALQPDLVVRSYGGGPNIAALLERAGIPVVQVGWANDFNGIRTVLMDMAVSLEAEEKGEAILADFDARMAAIEAREGGTALYVTPGGVTSGPGGLVHDMLVAAGLQNFQEAPGWRDLPLERMVHETPDVVAAAFYETIHRQPSIWSASRHSVVRDALSDAETVPLEGAWTSCGAWYLIEAIEALSERGQTE
ncbi:MAG: iron ABC transporter substrate-binding protein [Ponticaulis sp.]|nr:iron ABC transporter substrate-binding protein [Ponticaulis sp.]